MIGMTGNNGNGENGGTVEDLLRTLQKQHRELDQQIADLQEAGYRNQLEVQRLKKRKLALKDRIARLSSDRFPDVIA